MVGNSEPTDCFRIARENEAARAADATACIDTSVGAALLKNGWRGGRMTQIVARLFRQKSIEFS